MSNIKLYFSEALGTLILVMVGLSVVIINFGDGSPVVGLVPSEGIRRLITGFLFGSTGALIALSHIGKISGAHINPVVTFAFWLEGQVKTHLLIGYIFSQCLGAVLGAIPLLLWGKMGSSILFGATVPAHTSGGIVVALIGEIITTAALILGLFIFLGHKRLRPFTPLLFPFLYALMVYVEAPLSGTSTNPARSLGPALVANAWDSWWIYWLGPLVGTFLALGIRRITWLKKLEVEVAKLYHFAHDPHRVFSRQGAPQVRQKS